MYFAVSDAAAGFILKHNHQHPSSASIFLSRCWKFQHCSVDAFPSGWLRVGMPKTCNEYKVESQNIGPFFGVRCCIRVLIFFSVVQNTLCCLSYTNNHLIWDVGKCCERYSSSFKYNRQLKNEELECLCAVLLLVYSCAYKENWHVV